MHFEEKSAVHVTLRELARRLAELDVPYAMAGGMALFFHGFRRFTEVVDVLVTPEGLQQIHANLEGLGYVPLFSGSRNLRDAESGVRIEFLVTGDFPGDGRPKPIAFPDPRQVNVEKDGVCWLRLPNLIELKIASGMTSPGRLRELADVQELIRILDLPADLNQHLQPFVRDKYAELWASAQDSPRTQKVDLPPISLAPVDQTTMRDRIVRLLVERGKKYLNGKRVFVSYTELREADILINDLEGHPHAFVIACLMDRQMRAERAWAIPFHLDQRLGGFAFSKLENLTAEEVKRHMTEPKPLHRFPNEMSKNLHSAIAHIAQRYSGNAAAIWSEEPSSAEVVHRFDEFRGVGPKIANMAANLLVCDFKVPFKDYDSIDASGDVQVCRVFSRLGLTSPYPSPEAIVHTARALHPEFPALLDIPAWEIGRQWCRPQTPICGQCFMHQVCPSARRSTTVSRSFS